MPGLVLRPCARHFTKITSLQPHLNLKGGILIIIILLMRKTEVQGRGGAGPGSCCREAVEQDTVPKALIQSPCSWAVCPGQGGGGALSIRDLPSARHWAGVFHLQDILLHCCPGREGLLLSPFPTWSREETSPGHREVCLGGCSVSRWLTPLPRTHPAGAESLRHTPTSTYPSLPPATLQLSSTRLLCRCPVLLQAGC